MIDMGRNTTSPGFFLKRPTSFTTLVKANKKMSCVKNAYCRLAGSQSSVAHQREAKMRGSTTNAREVKVAMCSA